MVQGGLNEYQVIQPDVATARAPSLRVSKNELTPYDSNSYQQIKKHNPTLWNVAMQVSYSP
jgi:hypothetical protein